MLSAYLLLQPVDGKINNRKANLFYPRPKEHSYSNFVRSSNNFLGGILPKKIMGKFPQFEILPSPILNGIEPDANVVLIIGESLRNDKLSLLGYDKPTTPILDSCKSILFSSSIFSGGLMTVTSTSVLLNRLKYPGMMNQTIQGTNNLFRNAKKNNFQTYYISNQTKSSVRYMNNIASRKNIDLYCTKDDMNKYSGNLTSYDEDLISILKEIDLNKNNFIVLNQRGSHSPYDKQYPDNFDVFQNSYDNTVLYTDFVLSKVIEYFRKNSKKETYILFTSDHGELLGEHNKSGHGWFEKEVYNVPFIFISLNTDKDFSEVVKNIKCHYDVSNFVTTLLGYDIKEENSNKREIYVNSSDLDALAGYMKITIEQDSIISKEIIR